MVSSVFEIVFLNTPSKKWLGTDPEMLLSGVGEGDGDLERYRVCLETVSALDERVSRLKVRGTCSQSSDTGEPVREKRARSSPGI